jgi:hypothetical protein
MSLFSKNDYAGALGAAADGQGVAPIAKNGTGCGITGTGQRVSAF